MVAFTSLLAAVVAIAGPASLVSAEYLAVLKTTFPVGGMNTLNGCRDGAAMHEIFAWNTQTPSNIGGCKGAGSSLARSKNSQGTKMEGCHGGYTNGWSVCITGYGGNVHNGKGKHQRCVNDNTNILNCPSPICRAKSTRLLKCDGVWHNDA